MLKKIGITLLLASAFAIPVLDGTFGAPAQAANDQNAALEAIKRGEILSYSKIKKRVEKQLGGKIVGERLRRTNRGWIYEIRARQSDGRVVFAIVDAKTGRVIQKK